MLAQPDGRNLDSFWIWTAPFCSFLLMLQFLPLPAKIVVLPEVATTLIETLEEEVEEVWQAERERRGSTLFNGPIFSLEEISPLRIVGRFVGYRLFLAQERRPELFLKLRVQPLAVNGILQNAEGLFFGYRNSAVATHAESWELIPSGGVDRATLTGDGQLDPANQILIELWEEVGLTAANVSAPKLLCFTHDPLHHLFELNWELITLFDQNAVYSAHSAIANPEHSEIKCVRWADMSAFLGQDPDAVLPASRDLLKYLFE